MVLLVQKSCKEWEVGSGEARLNTTVWNSVAL